MNQINAKVKPSHPPAPEMIKAALESNPSRKGTSLVLIKKYLEQTYNIDMVKYGPILRRSLTNGVEKGIFLRVSNAKGASGSFKLPKPEKKISKKQTEEKKESKQKNVLEKNTEPKKTVDQKEAKPKKMVEKKEIKPKKMVEKKETEPKKTVAKKENKSKNVIPKTTKKVKDTEDQ